MGPHEAVEGFTLGDLRPNDRDLTSQFDAVSVGHTSPLPINFRYDTIRDAILTCARKPT